MSLFLSVLAAIAAGFVALLALAALIRLVAALARVAVVLFGAALGGALTGLAVSTVAGGGEAPASVLAFALPALIAGFLILRWLGRWLLVREIGAESLRRRPIAPVAVDGVAVDGVDAHCGSRSGEPR